jgi:hypothetical protein
MRWQTATACLFVAIIENTILMDTSEQRSLLPVFHAHSTVSMRGLRALRVAQLATSWCITSI